LRGRKEDVVEGRGDFSRSVVFRPSAAGPSEVIEGRGAADGPLGEAARRSSMFTIAGEGPRGGGFFGKHMGE